MARNSLIMVVAALAMVGCQGDSGPRNNPEPAPTATNTPNADVGSASPSANDERFRLELSNNQLEITEAGNAISLDVRIVRENGHTAPISLALRGSDASAEAGLIRNFTDTSITGNETTSTLQLELAAERAPILPHQRELSVIATDGTTSAIAETVTLNVSPTTAPDVYLLIGQSNMVGSSLVNSRRSEVGEADAPDERILQLNVTGNDSTNFPSPDAFTNPANIANLEASTVVALDALHDGFDFSINSKENTRIGLGLSFAKAMLPNTTANIMLVPAAWSDTGFCRRDTNLFPGVGWHATQPSDTTNFAGTLLHDRALARLNLTLEQSGGVFRGILWHQGEADSDNEVCAAAYEENLRSMVSSIRANARVDLRGEQARGPAADIPFIAGTLSFGLEFSILTPTREIVDGVHRNVASFIPFAATALNDDLVPPVYPCGEGGCIHFGATAYREIGARYAERMMTVQRQ